MQDYHQLAPTVLHLPTTARHLHHTHPHLHLIHLQVQHTVPAAHTAQEQAQTTAQAQATRQHFPVIHRHQRVSIPHMRAIKRTRLEKKMPVRMIKATLEREWELAIHVLGHDLRDSEGWEKEGTVSKWSSVDNFVNKVFLIDPFFVSCILFQTDP